MNAKFLLIMYKYFRQNKQVLERTFRKAGFENDFKIHKVLFQNKVNQSLSVYSDRDKS